MEQTNKDVIVKDDTNTGSKCSSKVILFNDEFHSFDDVVKILVAATGCTARKAFYHAYTVDKIGQDIVFSGDIEQAIKVSSIIESIALKTQIVT